MISRRHVHLLSSTALLAAAFLSTPAGAQTTNWTDATGSWFNAANWSNGVPTGGTTASNVANGGTPQIAGAAANGGTTLTLSNASTVELQAGGSLTANRIVLNNGTLFLSGSVDVTTPQVQYFNGTVISLVTGTLAAGAFVPNLATFAAAPGQTLTLQPAPGAFNDIFGAMHFGTPGNTGTVVFAGNGGSVSGGTSFSVDFGTLRLGVTSFSGNPLFFTSVGFTRVAAGATLDVHDQMTAGAGIARLLGAGNVILGVNPATNLPIQSGDFSGVISGPGGITRADVALFPGTPTTLTLSGTNTYLGATTVNDGTLIVNGSIATSSGLSVNGTGTIGGSGILPTTNVGGSATISPGNPIGTLTVAGALNLSAGTRYLVETNPSQSDRLNVVGAASINGAVVAVQPASGAYAPSTRYTILTATAVNGTFAGVTSNNAFLTPSLSYDASDVYLTLTRSVLFQNVGQTPNQRAVGGALDYSDLSGGLFQALVQQSVVGAQQAFNVLSGEVHASTVSVLADESLYMRSAILGRLRQASYGGDMGAMAALKVGPQVAFANGELDSALAYAKSPIVTKAPMRAPLASSDVVFWAQGFGASGRFDTDANAATVRRDLAGFISGVDTRVGSNGRLGVAAGYTGSKNALDGRGSANVDTGHVAAYGGWSAGSFNLRGGAAYAFHTIDTNRTIAFPGFFDNATAHYDGKTGQIFGEIGYGFALANIAVEPFAGAAWVRVQTDAAAERGGLAALNVASGTFETGYSTLGIRAAGMIPVGDGMVLIPRGSLAWQHAFNAVTPTSVLAFQTAPVPFLIAGVPIARDSLLAEAGLDLAIGRNATLGVSYVGQLAQNVTDHAAKGRFSWKF